MKFILRLFLTAVLSLHALAATLLSDRFERDATDRGIELTDWEGQIANPALEYFLQAPADLAFPVTATLRVNNPRVYFEAADSQISSNGSTRNFTFADPDFKAPFLISIFPDRDTDNELHEATVTYTDANQATQAITFPVTVQDQDRARPNDLTMLVDFTHDETGFFSDPARRQIVQQAADDWAYFFQGGYDPVGMFTELSFIWDKNGAVAGRRVLNMQEYTGFLIYVYGVFHPNLRSGGQGSYDGGFQSTNGATTQLRRSGNYHAEPRGNFNQLGWFLTQSDDDWWQAGNFSNQPNDLYSIAHHEIGHAFGFDQSYPVIVNSGGALQSQNLFAYFGYAPFNSNSHFDGLEDPASRKGAFGWEYFGTMSRRRWLITKLDLLCLEAIGYQLRDTTPFQPLTATNPVPAAMVFGRAQNHDFGLHGGVAPYNCTIQPGDLPPGIQLDAYTGALSGTPTTAGQFPITLYVADSGNPPQTIALTFDLTVTDEVVFELATLQPLPEGGLNAQLLSPGTTPYIIESSDDLENWTPVITNFDGGNFTFQDTTPGTGFRFYRARFL